MPAGIGYVADLCLWNILLLLELGLSPNIAIQFPDQDKSGLLVDRNIHLVQY